MISLQNLLLQRRTPAQPHLENNPSICRNCECLAYFLCTFYRAHRYPRAKPQRAVDKPCRQLPACKLTASKFSQQPAPYHATTTRLKAKRPARSCGPGVCTEAYAATAAPLAVVRCSTQLIPATINASGTKLATARINPPATISHCGANGCVAAPSPAAILAP